MYSTANHADSTNTSLNTRRTCTVPADTAIADIVLGFPGFGMIAGGGVETNIPNPFTVTASIEYPLGTTPRRVFFSGTRSGTVTPGPTVLTTDPFPGTLPAGARFAVKTHITWTGTMWLIPGASSTLRPPATAAAVGDWTNRGIALPDQTLTNTPQAQTTPVVGYAPIIYARPMSRVPALGTLGDSWFAGLNDVRDPVSGGATIIRAFRNKIPIGVSGQGGYNMIEFLQRPRGQTDVLRDACTHLIMELGINDVDAARQTLAGVQAHYLATIKPFMARGIRVIGWTPSPHTTSTDGYTSTANQTPVASETIRMPFVLWLRQNWRSIGLFKLVDAALALDPDNNGVWPVDPGSTCQTTTGRPPGAYATIRNGVVTGVSQATLPWQAGNTAGAGFPASRTYNWTACPYPGETGSGAFGTMTTTSAGVTPTNWTVISGGSEYSAPPMINLLGAFTYDGLHAYPRGWNEIIYKTGLGPGLLTFG